MKIRIFTIPVLGGEGLVEEMNRFLSSKKIIRTREKLVKNGSDGMFWSFTIRYIDDINTPERERLQQKVDYKTLLSDEEFSRFSVMRVIRKKVAGEDGVPPYAVFTDWELSELSKSENLTMETMREIKGIGEKKLEKYGQFFLQQAMDEKTQ
jgi:superfamily II DNA helicase RecQ